MLLFNISTILTVVTLVSGLALPQSEDESEPRSILDMAIPAASGPPACFDDVGGEYSTINDGIDAIRARIPRDGPYFWITPTSWNDGKCVQMTCSYDVGIYACNDGDDYVVVTFETLAQYAEKIRDGCGPGTGYFWVYGQQFASLKYGRWNVFIRSSEEHC